MSTSILGRAVWMGSFLALCLGTAGVQAQDAASSAGAGSTNNTPVSTRNNAGKRELTAEQKSFEESIKTFRAESGRMNVSCVNASRTREKTRRDKEKASKTPMILSSGSNGNGAGNSGGQNQGNQGGSTSDSSSNGKGK